MLYCAFHKHANSKVQKPPWQLRFSLPSIIITITSNEPWNTETHKTDQNPPITNHKPWPFEPVKVKFCFLRGPLRWLTAAKNAIVSWLLNFRIRMFSKSAVTCLANFPEWIRERKLHSSFLLSPQLSCGKACRQVTHASKGWLYRMFIILPSNHQNISRNSIWLANDTEFIVGHKTRVHCPFAKSLIPLIVNN